MIEKIAAFVARYAGKPRSTSLKVASLIGGFVVFFVVAPLILRWVSRPIAARVHASLPRPVELTVGVAAVLLGLALLVWSLATFWYAGRGTPVPFASPTRLVTSGPFRYTRNPIKLGAVLFYLGVGATSDSLLTGIIMLAIGVTLGTIYHKAVEEKELLIRFGSDYANYRRRTSFLIPWPPRE
jgi:protein-S-isoprenylcysteine O-methyltransferase Ste14